MSTIEVKSSDPKLWGPALWKFLHLMAASYPETPDIQYKASSRQFFYALRHLLPCETCRSHYTQLLGIKQPQIDSARDMQEWVLWLHNEVNARVNSSAKQWTMDDIYKTYCSMQPNSNASENSQTNQTKMKTIHPRNRQFTDLSNNLRSDHTKSRRASRSALQMRNNNNNQRKQRQQRQQRQRMNSSLSPPLTTTSTNRLRTPFNIRPSVGQQNRTKLRAQKNQRSTVTSQNGGTAVVEMGTGNTVTGSTITDTTTDTKKDCGCKK